MNFYATSQRTNYNQGSQYHKPYKNNSNNRNYGASSYQNSVPATQERKIETMIDQAVLECQQKLNVDFNGKIDDVYTDLKLSAPM